MDSPRFAVIYDGTTIGPFRWDVYDTDEEYTIESGMLQEGADELADKLNKETIMPRFQAIKDPDATAPCRWTIYDTHAHETTHSHLNALEVDELIDKLNKQSNAESALPKEEKQMSINEVEVVTPAVPVEFLKEGMMFSKDGSAYIIALVSMSSGDVYHLVNLASGVPWSSATFHIGDVFGMTSKSQFTRIYKVIISPGRS